MRSAVRLANSLLQCTRGLASVELALLTPVLALMLVGAFDLGVAYVQGQRLESAAHSGTQRVLQDPLSASDTLAVELLGLEEYFNKTITDGERKSLPVSAAASCFRVCPDDSELDCGLACEGGEDEGTFVELTLTGTSNMTLSYPFTGRSEIEMARTSVVRVE